MRVKLGEGNSPHFLFLGCAGLGAAWWLMQQDQSMCPLNILGHSESYSKLNASWHDPR